MNSVVTLVKPNGKNFVLNSDELAFCNAVITAFSKAGIPFNVHLSWKSGDVINFYFLTNFPGSTCQIGRIKLRNNNKRMQILSKEKCVWIDDIDLQTALSLIPQWVDYAKRLVQHPGLI